ncbi:MAG TPA: site-specific DNA-methyltransferase [Candidatus Pelethenecus sp.]|nr:site-specific DNA-methyltransferase [Candidatus Pelethenecus sp.]
MSTNVSKQKRDNLIEKIKEIKNYIQFTAQDENSYQLLSYLADIEKDIKGKKYGLVFEEHKENIDDLLIENAPVLTEDKDLFIDNGGKMNFLIEGDNLASLQLLEKTHKGKIDFIYIDPPYNTGKKDFKYDDSFVSDDDSFRHSKWLSFIERRLRIAKAILNECGIIFISIDDNEQATLKILCDNIFGYQNFIDCFIWMKNPNPTYLNKYSRSCCEYVLCYAKDLSKLDGLDGGIVESTETDAPLQNKGNPKRTICVQSQSAIFKCEDQFVPAGNYGLVDLLDDVYIQNGKNKNDFRIVGTFRMTEETLRERISLGDKLIFKTNRMAPRLSYNANTKHSAPLKLILDKYGTTQTGNNELKRLLDTEDFSYPKPSSLIKYLITLYPNNKNATILDFFAGSGTTGHAVMKLNAEDGGKRNFILCTNNENNICREITYERIKRVIEKENFKESLKYYKVEYVPITDKLYYEYADELLKNIRELVELENGINFIGNAEIAIILTEEELDDFTSTLNESSICKSIYLGHDVLPDEQQETLFKKYSIKINIIPDYYYRDLEG